MIWLYRLLFLPGLFIALPYYLLRMWRRGGYAKDFQHRFGRFARLPETNGNKCRIWLQAVSVGEVLAVGPLIDALRNDQTIEIVLTTTTSTGYAEARKRYQDKVTKIGIFPLDFWCFSHTAWKRIQPDALILTEGELWPEHLHQARKRNIPTFLVNARLSQRSFERYKKIPGLAARLLRKIDAVFAASDLDEQRMIELGAPSGRITSLGSIKFDAPIGERLSENAKKMLRTELGFESIDGHEPFVLLGSSTWPGEEAALIRIQQKAIAEGIDCALLLVPRHAERGPELSSLLTHQPLSWHQRSTGTQPSNPIRIHLADTTGELARLSQAADLAFVGKSLNPNEGGQTPIEAAGLGIPVLMGPNMSNFTAVARSLVESGAARQVNDVNELEQQVIELINTPETRTRMSEAGLEWHRRNRGSSQRIAEAILSKLGQPRH